MTMERAEKQAWGVAIAAHALLSFGTRDGALHINVRGEGERAKAAERLVREV